MDSNCISSIICDCISLWSINSESLRQLGKISRTNVVPDELRTIISADLFRKISSYGKDRMIYAIYHQIFSLVLNLIIIQYNVLALFWDAAVSFCQSHFGFGSGSENEIIHSLVFLTIFTMINTVLDLPWKIADIFLLEQKHGFNNQTFSLFCRDIFTSLLLSAAIGYPLVSAFIWITVRMGDNFYLYLCLTFLVFQIVLIQIYPYISLLYNKFEQLTDGPLKSEIEKLAQSVSFPLDKIFVIDGSKRSNHSNAYFYGLFSKRIVLFDTLIKQTGDHEEITAILAHEIGHWHHSHTLKMLMLSQVHIFVLFLFFSMFLGSKGLFYDFGFVEQPKVAVIISFMLFSYIISPFESLFTFMTNVTSRMFEYEADEYAKRLGMSKKLCAALINLTVENKSVLWHDEWYSAWNHSHPTTIHRISALGVDVGDILPKKTT